MKDVQWLTEREQAAWRGLLLMYQSVQARIERDLAVNSQLSGADYAVLVTLSEDVERRVRMTDLASRMSWSKSRLSHQVSRMEQRGLVKRTACGEDARGLWLTLTDVGLSTIEAAAPAHVESVRKHFLATLADVDIDELARIADGVVRHHDQGGRIEVCDEGDAEPCPDAARGEHDA